MGTMFDGCRARSVGRKAVNDVVREEQNFNENEGSVQMRKQLANRTLDNAHTYKRSDTDLAYENSVLSFATRRGRTKR